MSGGFGLCKIEDFFEVGNTHFAVHHNKTQDAKTGFIRASFKNLGPQRQVKTFESHLASYVSRPKVYKLGAFSASPYI